MKDFGLSELEGEWIEEKSSEELTELSQDFYEDAANYATELARELEGSRDLRRDLLREELEHVLEMIQEIYLLRTLKMADTLFEKREGTFLEEERRAFEQIKKRLEDLREELVGPVVRGETELRPPREASNDPMLILTRVSEPIVASDMSCYGPFEEGEIVNIPKKTAELLADQGLARRLEVKGA